MLTLASAASASSRFRSSSAFLYNIMVPHITHLTETLKLKKQE